MKPLLDHFGILAPFYERFIKPNYPERLIALAELKPDSILLDVGAGTGRLAQFFHTKAAQIVVIDESLDMLLQSKMKEGLQPNLSHAELLPFQTHTFDRILMVDVLHHVADQQKTADELWRVLKPGGRIIIEEPNIHKLSSKLIAVA
ncbi:MAG: class I SAM-dependent methyltransferase, partial [Saprospiraceae bacterium]|nr:class I SAM-dependent methyltransferase [Saprospiraceae bacterium]